jgi:hypothetical protein
MSEVKVNKISPRSGTAITLGDSGDTFTIPSGATLAIAGSVTGFTSAGIDDNATSVAITINSSEQVGIGTTSPDHLLHISASSSNAQLKLQRTGSATASYNISASSDALAFSDQVAGSERMRITSTGLGIGTSSPSRQLTVSGSTAPVIAIVDTGTSGTPSLFFGDSSADNVGKIQYANSNNSLATVVNGSERMRIDSSGRLNLGTTTSISGSLLNIDGGFINANVTDSSHKFIRSTTATTGLGDPMICRVNTSADMADGFASVITFQVSDSGVSNSSLGFIGATRSGADNSGSLIFHTYNNGSQSEKVRITSAGNVGIGTTSPVGVVGTDKVLEIKGSSNPGLVINDTGQAEKYAFHALATKLNMYYGATAFLTYDASTSGVGINNASPSQSLDVTGSIEVSDGIYLGGTGTANKLSDYEEGTWTPVYSPATGSFTSVTYNIQRGTYTKVGRQVTLLLQLRTNAITVGTASGALYVEGLPFTASSDSAKITYTPLGIRTGWTNNPSTLRTQVSSTYARVSENFDNTATEVSDMNTGSNGNFLALEFTYFTD